MPVRELRSVLAEPIRVSSALRDYRISFKILREKVAEPRQGIRGLSMACKPCPLDPTSK
jgi:hypothetical protein